MKRTRYQLMAVFSGILVSLLMRYPLVPHEQGWDSFIIHQMGQSVNRYGYMKWVIHPLSYIGYYPYSYASGVPAVLSSISQISGLEMEYTILLFCFFESVLFFLLAYMAASQFTNKFMFKMFVAFLYSLSPGVIWFSDWTVSTRGALIMLMPLFIFLLFKSQSHESRNKMLGLALFIFLMAATIHNMFLFFLIILIAFFISKVIFTMKYAVSSTSVGKKGARRTRLMIQGVFLLVFLGLIYVPVFLNLGLSSYRHINYDMMMDLGRQYGGKLGLLFVLLPVGIYFLLKTKRKGLPEVFMMLMTILLAPILLSPYYVSLGFLFIFLMLCTYALTPLFRAGNMKSPDRRKVKAVTMALLLILVAGWSFQAKMHIISTNKEGKLNPDYCDQATYDTAIVLRYMEEGAFISNDYVVHGRISAYSERPNIVDRIYLINGYISPDDMKIVRKSNVLDWFNGGPYEDKNNVPLEYRYWSPLKYRLNSVTLYDLKYKYHIRFYVEKNEIAGELNYYNYGIVPSPHLQYLDETEYTIYENSDYNIKYFR